MVTNIIKNEDIHPNYMIINGDWCTEYNITNQTVLVCKSKWANHNKTTCGLLKARNKDNNNNINPVTKW